MGFKTALFNAHKQAGAKIVDFGGWDMPIHYGSQLEEHHIVRKNAGMFDVSHMTIVDVLGPQSRDYLRYLLANDVDKLLVDGKALYSGMLDENGGVIDDLIVYRMPSDYRLVVNCGTREKDLAWMTKQAKSFDVELKERSDLAMIAVQGPDAITSVKQLKLNDASLIDGLAVFQGLELAGCIVERVIRAKTAWKYYYQMIKQRVFGMICWPLASNLVVWVPVTLYV